MSNTEEIACPVCESPNVKVIRRTAARTSKSGVAVSFPDELMECAECGERYYTYEQSMANSGAFTTALSEAQGLMVPGEIRAARLNLGYSQPEFEAAFGFGKKTAIRWEKGTVAPSRAANFALWIAAHYPDLIHEYAARPTRNSHPVNVARAFDQITSAATLMAHISPEGTTRFRKLRETKTRAGKSSVSAHRKKMSTQPASQESSQA